MEPLDKKRTPAHFKLSHILVLGTVLLILSASFAFGQQKPPGTSKIVERDASGKAKRVNLNFANAELQVVLKWLADEADLTIIATEGDIKGKKFALMNVKNVTIDEAMEHIKTVLALQGLTLIQTDNTIMVTTLSKLPVRRSRLSAFLTGRSGFIGEVVSEGKKLSPPRT